MAYKRSELVSTIELARWLDCTGATVRNLSAEGILEKAVDEQGKEKLGRYALRPNIIRYVRFLKSKKEGAEQAKSSLEDLTRRQLEAKVERAELLLEAQRGNLHSSKLIYDLYADRIRACRDTALGLPNKVAQTVADETNVATVFKILTQEVEDMLSKLAAPQSDEVMKQADLYITDPDAEAETPDP
jgi:hypothetical protein